MMQKSLDIVDWQQVRLSEETVIKPFDSGDADLNDFLMNDAKKHLNSLLTATYLIKVQDEIIAYFCLSNDCLTKDNEDKSAWNKVNRTIDNEKRRRNYPAVKIGRLAVAKNYAGLGFGKLIIRIVRELYTNKQQQSGCRFITVDAYRNALSFYEKNLFKYMTDKDKFSETRAMYFDLKSVK
jgi:GNAT superfamily N-acetyltransferase